MPTQEVSKTATQTYSDYSPLQKDSIFGGELDTWGVELTVEQVTDPSFRIIFDADLPSGTLCVDDVTAEVFFTLPYTYNPTGRPIPVPSALQACAIGAANGYIMIVIVGAQGGIKTSTNFGATWTDQNSGVADNLWDVSATAEGFVACGDNGVILESTDGSTWVRQASGTTQAIFAVNGKRVKLAGSSAIHRKTTSWQIVRTA